MAGKKMIMLKSIPEPPALQQYKLEQPPMSEKKLVQFPPSQDNCHEEVARNVIITPGEFQSAPPSPHDWDDDMPLFSHGVNGMTYANAPILGDRGHLGSHSFSDSLDELMHQTTTEVSAVSVSNAILHPN